MNKYLMIIMKELRHIVPLTILTIIILAVFVSIYFNFSSSNENSIINAEERFFTYMQDPYLLTGQFRSNDLSSGMLSKLNGQAIFLIWHFGVLAFLIAFIQFWLPSITKNWKFIIHRPVSRMGLIISILSLSICMLFLANGICWSVICGNVAEWGLVPLERQVYWMGWKAGLIPIVCYATTALCGLVRTKIFFSKLPFALGAIIIFFLLLCSTGIPNIMLSLLFLAMVIPSVIYYFINNEY